MATIRRLPPEREEELRRAPFTYPEVGGTRARYPDGFPRGYRLARHRAVVGHGFGDLERATERLMTWRMHAGAGLRVESAAERVAPGEVVLLRLGPGRLSLPIPCRVAYVVEEETRRGFGYGTLPGHPETGEEAFTLSLEGDAPAGEPAADGAVAGDGAVLFTATAFSNAGRTFTRLAGPLAWWAQDVALRRYAAAVRPRR